MMALSTDDVKKIAALARLRFDPEEEALLTRQLDAIVRYIDQLEAFAGTEPAGGEGGGKEADDQARPGLPREQFLANAPRVLDSFLVVPEVKGGGDA